MTLESWISIAGVWLSVAIAAPLLPTWDLICIAIFAVVVTVSIAGAS